MKTLRTIGTVAITGAVLALVPVGSASAADTTTTFSLTGGGLGVTAAGAAALADGATGAGSVSGSLGAVAVSDTRGSIAGWIMSAASTTFVDGSGSTSTAVVYDSGAAATTGTVTPTSPGAKPITTTATPVAAGTLAIGNNTASYNPNLTVSLPASALAGAYTGTVTTSVA